MGLTFLLDGKTMPDKVVYTPGKHVAAIVVAGKKYTQEFRVSYSVKEALLKKRCDWIFGMRVRAVF